MDYCVSVLQLQYNYKFKQIFLKMNMYPCSNVKTFSLHSFLILIYHILYCLFGALLEDLFGS